MVPSSDCVPDEGDSSGTLTVPEDSRNINGLHYIVVMRVIRSDALAGIVLMIRTAFTQTVAGLQG